MVEFDGLPEDQQDELQRKLATLRDEIPPVPFSRLEKLLRKELGAPLGTVFSDFDERAFAAASIGQVHRATTLDGDEVVVKVQYPGVAEAVETDLRNAMLLVPLVKRLAPGPRRQGDGGRDARADRRGARLRARGPEPAPDRAADARASVHLACRASTPTCRPGACWSRSTSRENASRRCAEPTRPQRDRYGEIVFRFFFGLLYRDRIALGDPHPGNYLLRPDGRVCFLDFGLLRDVDAARVARGGGDRARGPRATTPADLKAASGRGRLSARRASGRGRRGVRAAADATRDQVVRRARVSVGSRSASGAGGSERRDGRRERRDGDRERPDGDRASRGQDAGQPVHPAARRDPDPADARHRRDRPANAAGRR